MNNRPHLLATGFAVGLETLTNLEFQLNKPYRACLLCGAMYQTDLDRSDPTNVDRIIARKLWAEQHAKQHPAALHHKLRISGNFALPEAAHKLAAFGIFSLNDLVLDNEVSSALRLSSSVPTEDAQS